MRRVQFAHTNITSSCLGFGCVSLTIHDDRSKAIRILETAFDSGITHFDVARLYGYGQAEGILGEFLKSKRDKVTVATKFGLEASGAVAKSRKLVNIARWFAHRSKFISKLARRATAQNATRGKFNPVDAQASLETSLRELGTDHVDLFLLHECTLRDASQDDLIAFLTAQVQRGTIRGFGPATEFDKLQSDASLFPAAHTVMQFNSNSLQPNIELLKNSSTRDRITFGAVNCAKRLAEFARTSPHIAAPFQTKINADLLNPDVVAGLLLRDALDRNPGGIVLFASTQAARVKANIEAATNSQVSPPAAQAFREYAAAASRMIAP